jgi:retinol dehydrogenase-12
VPSEDLKDKVCIVTGANAGIGLVTARELAMSGARVVLACRSEEKGLAAVAAILKDTGSETVEFLQLDLSDLASVKRASEEFLSKEIPLHLLINNAGLAGNRGQTKQGFEIQFGVNHLGPFLFTQLLLPALEKAGLARIVNVASRGHLRASGINFGVLTTSTKSIAGFKEYCVSKLANVLFNIELAKRLPEGVTTYSLHPGVIKSEIWRRIPWPIRPLVTRKMLTVEEGAKTSLHCATNAGIAKDSGRYYADCKEAPTNKVATEELALELWNRSEEWCQEYR